MKERMLLEVQASVRQQSSVSRQLSATFIDAWRSNHPNIQHVVRDVGISPPDHPTQFWVKAHYTPPEERSQEMIDVLAASDALINELLAADYIVLADPNVQLQCAF